MQPRLFTPMPAGGTPIFRRRSMDTILVANAGSSSVKFQVFEIEPGPRLKRQSKASPKG